MLSDCGWLRKDSGNVALPLMRCLVSFLLYTLVQDVHYMKTVSLSRRSRPNISYILICGLLVIIQFGWTRVCDLSTFFMTCKRANYVCSCQHSVRLIMRALSYLPWQKMDPRVIISWQTLHLLLSNSVSMNWWLLCSSIADTVDSWRCWCCCSVVAFRE